jgi:capsular exopolysaccharide synthesis family protein
MVPHKQFPEPSPGNDLAAYRPQVLGAPAMISSSAPIGHHEALAPALWRRRWSIVGITLVALVCGLAYIHHAQKLYPGISTITLSTNQPAIQWTGPVASPTIDPSWINTKIDIIRSTGVLEAAAVKMGLDKQYTPDQLGDLVQGWGNYLYVDPGAKDYTITITFEDKNPMVAAKTANAIVEAYQEYENDNSSENTNNMLTTLKGKATELATTRQQQFDALQKFREDHPEFMASLTQDSKGVLGLNNNEINKLNDAISTATLDQIEAQANFDAAKEAHDSPEKLRQMAGPAVVSQLDPQGQTLRVQLGDVDLQIDLLTRKGYLPNSPLMVQDQTLAAELLQQLKVADAAFADAYVGAMYQKLLACNQKIDEYRREKTKVMADYAVENTVAAEYTRLSDQLAETTGLLDSLNESIRKLDVVGSGSVNVQVIEPARIAMAPNLPPKLRVLGIALAVGLLLGIGLGLLRDRLDQRIHTPDEVVGLLGVPVIGMIPHMRRSLTPVARGQAVHWDPMSEVAEAYRAVRTAVTFGVPAGAAKTIVVTSPTPGDGKSTLASNLAIALAQAGKRTLLLDSDFRRPVQHKLFEMSHEMGVTSVLAGRDALNKAIQKTACEGLDLLPSGPIPLNPSELLNGESFAEILDELAGVYDHIVLDCPPVMSVTDARILGAVCDVTILVVRANKVTRRNVEHARAMLASVGARLLGCVINDVPRGQGQEGYYGGYGYAPIEPVVRRREDVETAGINGYRHLPAPVDAGNGR